MVTQSALGAPLYALMVLVVSVKMFGFLRAISRYIERLLSHKTTFTMLRDVRVQFLKGLIPRVPNIYRRFNSSDLISSMISKVESLQNIYLRVYYPPIVIGLTTLIALITMYFFSYWHMIIIAVSMLLSLLVVPNLSAKRARILKHNIANNQRQFLTRFYDYKQGFNELERFKMTDYYYEKVKNNLSSYSKSQAKEQQFLTLYDFALNMIAMVSIFFSLFIGMIAVQSQQLNVIYLTSIVLMVLTLFEQAVPMSNYAYYKADTTQSLQDINQILDTPIEQETHSISKQKSNVFEIKNMMFKYYNQETPTLKNINLSIEEGEKVALIGPSGSGKSTLLQIMLGLYQIDSGDVQFYGQDVTSIFSSEKYRYINALLQSQQMFDGTVRYNLLSNKSDEEMETILQKLNLGYLSLDRELSVEEDILSGGEKQRLAIARLLLNTGNVWILDEPTTALDETNQRNVMNLIKDSAQTLIIATHQLELLEQFDKIFVIIDGEIIEEGSYEALISRDSYLSELINDK